MIFNQKFLASKIVLFCKRHHFHSPPEGIVFVSRTKNPIMAEQSFQLLLNGVPYVVKATPYEFNTETRFKVSYNGSEEYVFTFDPSVGQYVAIGDDTSNIPADVEVAIAERLYAIS